MDRRADPRVEVRLPCHAVFPRSRSRVFVGLTENISRNGLLVAWSSDFAKAKVPRTGDLLALDIELPASHSFGRRCMHCEAVVTRVVPPDNGDGPRIAFQVNQMKFRNYGGRFLTAAGGGEISCVM